MIKQIATATCLFTCIAPALADDEKDKEAHAETPSAVLQSLPAEVQKNIEQVRTSCREYFLSRYERHEHGVLHLGVVVSSQLNIERPSAYGEHPPRGRLPGMSVHGDPWRLPSLIVLALAHARFLLSLHRATAT